MTTQTATSDTIAVQDAPSIPGLSFRRFRGASDFPKMVEVATRSKAADGIEEVDSAEEIARYYTNLKNSDPYQDLVIVEVNGEAIGYKRVEWWAEHDGTHIYGHFGFLVPEWRGKGIGRALIRHSEHRLREIAAEHARERTPLFDSSVYERQKGLAELLKSEGYAPVRYGYDMVRPNLEDIPDAPLPEGLQVRPVVTEHYRAIWEAENEAFRDHWGTSQHEEQDFVRWQDNQWFQPQIWQIAWDGDQVVGMVRNFILPEENKRYARLRGYTENISVRRPWRKRGVARALIASSFRLLKDLGMQEAALSVDAENPSGALQLYESMGFQVVRSGTTYRKPVDP